MTPGLDNSLPPGPSNTLFQLRMSGETWLWSTPLVFGELPEPRWKHTATLWDKTKIVIFGGNFSSSCRFNDLWTFNTVTMTWSRPIEPGCTCDSDGNHVVNTGSDPATPSPRGAHSACILGDVLYVFGGFGGVGFSRRDFNDLYGLNLEEMKWQKVISKGKAPEVRVFPRTCDRATIVFVTADGYFPKYREAVGCERASAPVCPRCNGWCP